MIIRVLLGSRRMTGGGEPLLDLLLPKRIERQNDSRRAAAGAGVDAEDAQRTSIQ